MAPLHCRTPSFRSARHTDLKERSGVYILQNPPPKKKKKKKERNPQCIRQALGAASVAVHSVHGWSMNQCMRAGSMLAKKDEHVLSHVCCKKLASVLASIPRKQVSTIRSAGPRCTGHKAWFLQSFLDVPQISLLKPLNKLWPPNKETKTGILPANKWSKANVAHGYTRVQVDGTSLCVEKKEDD